MNAPALIKVHGIDVDAKYEPHENFEKCVSATAVFEDGSKLQLAGSHFDTTKSDRLLEIDSLPLDVTLKGWMLFVRYPDKPGMIGRVGSVIGNHNINISVFQVTPTEAAGAAMVVAMESELTEDMLAGLKKEIPEITSARIVLV